MAVTHPKLQALTRYLSSTSDIYSALLSLLGGPYTLYDERALTDRVRRLLGRSRDTLKEALLCEDYEEEGKVNLQGLKDAIKSVCEEADAETVEYMVYLVYNKSEDI